MKKNTLFFVLFLSSLTGIFCDPNFDINKFKKDIAEYTLLHSLVMVCK
jgi:hypothetical protein